MSDRNILTQEELLKRYEPMICSWAYRVSSQFCRESSFFASQREDILQEARIGFLLGLKRCNDYGYPLANSTVGMCRIKITEQLSRNLLTSRTGIRYPQKKRMAVGTQYLVVVEEDENGAPKDTDYGVEENTFDSVEFRLTIDRLPNRLKALTAQILKGTPMCRIRADLHLTRTDLSKALNELRKYFEK